MIGPLVLCSILDSGIRYQVVIDGTSSPSFDIWQTNNYGDGAKNQITYNIYFFHTQNPEEIVRGERPIVVELGPYAFNEYFYKFDISWSDNGDS